MLVWVSLAGGVVVALAVLLSVVQPVAAQSAGCPEGESLRVPGAEQQEAFCLPDLTTEGLVDGRTTNRSDWLVTPSTPRGP